MNIFRPLSMTKLTSLLYQLFLSTVTSFWFSWLVYSFPDLPYILKFIWLSLKWLKQRYIFDDWKTCETLTSITLVTRIDNPSEGQTPNKATEGAVNYILSLVERPAVFFVRCIHTVYSWNTQCNTEKPTNKALYLSWNLALKDMKKQHGIIWKQQLNPFLILRDFSVETNRNCLSCLIFRCYWSKELASLSQPIRSKMKTNGNFVTRMFPRFKQFACFYVKFLLAPSEALLSSDWLLWLLWFWFNVSQSKCAIYGSDKYKGKVPSSIRFLL